MVLDPNVSECNVYAYDAQGNQTEDISYLWDKESNDWVYSGKTESYWSALKSSFDDLNYPVYPDPFSDHATIRLPDDRLVQRIDLIDAFGRIVSVIDEIDTHNVTIRRGHLSAGIYFIRIYSNNTVVRKIIIK